MLPAQGTECAEDLEARTSSLYEGIQRGSASLEHRKAGQWRGMELQRQGGATQPGLKTPLRFLF